MLKPIKPDAPTRWRTRAFGLELDSAVEIPGLPPDDGINPASATRLDVVSEAALDQGWPRAEAIRLLEEREHGNPQARTIDHHPSVGYRLYASGYGLAQIDPDGRRVRCSPPERAQWRWQRFMSARVLPCAAILRGIEVFHAGAVVLDRKAIALVGPSGAGKTSLALGLVQRGGEFLTDDVLAVDDDPAGGLRAHPGASIASLRDSELEFAASEAGQLIGREDKAYLSLPRAAAAVPLGALYFLTRRPETAPRIERLSSPDPRILMASTFVLAVRTPRRLATLLEICATIARSVPVFRIDLDEQSQVRTVAEMLDNHAREVIGT